ncbi:hypothetical protein BSKO_11059 [Bryopsis sp. KO-2023]|nr:hypothetical protein BSKO_11059 [Bryopsis sp. KO-2023]
MRSAILPMVGEFSDVFFPVSETDINAPLRGEIEGSVAQHEFDSKDPYFSALTELGLSVLPEKRSACSIMEVYLESGKVKADIKTGFDFTGNLREYIQYLGGDGSSISMCKDGILECHIDFSNYSRIVYQGHSTMTVECTSGKCLDLGPGALPM